MKNISKKIISPCIRNRAGYANEDIPGGEAARFGEETAEEMLRIQYRYAVRGSTTDLFNTRLGEVFVLLTNAGVHCSTAAVFIRRLFLLRNNPIMRTMRPWEIRGW